MEKIKKRKLFLVDDDALFLKTLEIQFLEMGNFDVETFSTGERCLENLHKNPEVVILDYHLDGVDPTAMNGLKTLDRIKEINSSIPVIMLSSQDKIEVAVSCMHHKAFDYVVKSETAFMRLQKIIDAIFQYNKMEKELNWYMSRM
jgi:two-component system, OmpR family, response regulator